MTFKGFIKVVVGLFGSLMMTIGVTIIFLGLVFVNVEKNVDSLDGIVKAEFTNFMESNREDVRQIAIDQMAKENKNIEFNKEDMVTACSNRAVLNEDAKKLLTEEFCGKVTTMNYEDIRNAMLDQMIESNKDKFVEQMSSSGSSDQIKGPIMGIKSVIGSFMTPVYIGIFITLIGILLIFVSAGFVLLDGAYKAASKLAINLASFGVVFTALRFIQPETLLNWAMKSGDMLKGADVQSVPPAILKIMAGIVLEWIRLSTNPLILVAFLAMLPFAGVAIYLYIRRRKAKKEVNTFG